MAFLHSKSRAYLPFSPESTEVTTDRYSPMKQPSISYKLAALKQLTSTNKLKLLLLQAFTGMDRTDTGHSLGPED